MLVIMKDHASASDIQQVVDPLAEVGAEAHLSRADIKTIIGVIGDREVRYSLELGGLPGVEQVIRVLTPYKLVSDPEHARCDGPQSLTTTAFAELMEDIAARAALEGKVPGGVL